MHEDMQAQQQAGQLVVERLQACVVGEALQGEQMSVIPIVGDAAGQPHLEYRTLAEALDEDMVEVSERPTATVPELLLRNHSQAMILVLDGEEIVGGKQNRIVNASFLVAAEATIMLPVTCVEAGRWHETSGRFAIGESSYFSLKREKHTQVAANLRVSRSYSADQHAVWNHVAERAARAGSVSDTQAMHEIYQFRQEALDTLQRTFAYPTGAVGMIVALNGHIAGADLFDQPRTMEALWPKVIRSYALDALDASETRDQHSEPVVAREHALRFLRRTKGAACEVFPSRALGDDVRLRGDGIIGGALVYNETPVHISLFRTDDEPQPSAATGQLVRSTARRQRLARRQGPPAPEAPENA